MSSVSEARRREAFKRALCFFRSSARRGVMSDILAEMERLLLVTMFGSWIEECWLSSDLILNIFPSGLIH